MKVTMAEKKMIWGLVVVLVILVLSGVFSARYLLKHLENEGGLKSVIVKIGKEVKDIRHQINQD